MTGNFQAEFNERMPLDLLQDRLLLKSGWGKDAATATLFTGSGRAELGALDLPGTIQFLEKVA